MDFNFDLAEPLETRTTNHQRNFSRSLLSNIKFEPRTAEQREADAKRNAPKYAREKAVNSMLTARFLKAKKTFDAFWGYSIDEAWDGDAGEWRLERDPWLRAALNASAVATGGEEKDGNDNTMVEFLREYTKQQVEAHKEGIEKDLVSVEELEALAAAVVRVARVDVEAAGRDNKALNADFKKSLMRVVGELQTEYHLPQSAPEEEVVDEEGEEAAVETNGA
ncbi:hypothetical protein BD289DRAFT_140989 [Coniella lustricola]|uniref:Uncharacterized protein n=1 Tax=Coniella lustricola TaxID=2025994 RepID=A0A2T3AF75_9PEZI|nr:hypothetical protein BD289DRAFT_140989 [Coniella lustricola]